jgi:hypothetical protein
MNDDRRIPDLFVERDALGELPLDLDRDTRERLEAEPGRAARLSELDASNREILDRYPVEQMTARIRKGLQEAPAPRRRIALRLALVSVPAAALVIVAVLLLVGRPAGPGGEIRSPKETILLKGDPALVIHRRLPQGSEALKPGDPARPGDQLQLSYVPKDANHGVILSIDGRGQMTLHFPADASRPTTLEHKDLVSLPFSYELDDAPGFERFVFVTSRLPIPVDRVLEAAGKLGADPLRELTLPPGWKQKSFLLNKP